MIYLLHDTADNTFIIYDVQHNYTNKILATQELSPWVPANNLNILTKWIADTEPELFTDILKYNPTFKIALEDITIPFSTINYPELLI